MAAVTSSVASSSTCISSEAEVKPHIFQSSTGSGPKGAYEAQQVNGGLYVRVDMPGVPPCGVKLMKYGDTRTVTFSGKAPKSWPEYDTSDRVYGGYVVLDRDPTEVDVEMHVKNGVMRLFFPNADGTLHFLKPKKQQPQQDEDESMSHINPYLLQGVEGVDESKSVFHQTTKEVRLYLRVDFPGLGEKEFRTKRIGHNFLMYGGEGQKEFRFDEAGREYAGFFAFQCSCCRTKSVDHELKDGVMRMLISKSTISQDIKSVWDGGAWILCRVSVCKYAIGVRKRDGKEFNFRCNLGT